MKKFFSGMIIVAAITAGSAWWFQKFYIDQPDNPSSPFFKIDDIVGDQSNNELEINSEQILTKEVDAPVGRKRAKRLVFIPDNNPDRSQSDREIDVEFQHSVNQMVESSLTGKKEGAIALSQLFNQCSVEFEHEAQIRSRLQMTDQTGFNPQAHYSLGNGEMRKFESVEAYEIFLWERFDQCRVIRNIFVGNLHERISLLADYGNPVARYLFAMWPPSGGMLGTDNMSEWLEYQSQALEYTWQNIDEHEPLGLLAFGQSFRSSRPGFFTAVKHQYAQAFLMAAKKCGLSSLWLDAEISKIKERLNRGYGGGTHEQIEGPSDEIKKLFCD